MNKREHFVNSLHTGFHLNLQIIADDFAEKKEDVSILCREDPLTLDGLRKMCIRDRGNERLYQIMKEKEAIYAKEDFTDEDGIRASELEGEFAEMNGWEAESDAATLLNGLGVDTEFHYTQMADLTGSMTVSYTHLPPAAN